MMSLKSKQQTIRHGRVVGTRAFHICTYQARFISHTGG